jgi:pimeloyl-ACP methyl ester carboxylesterase
VYNLLVDDYAFQSKGARTLFITFAGMSGILRTLATLQMRIGIEARPFEFVNSLRDKECDVLFLRDRNRAYYHSGIRGVGGSIDEVAGCLKEFIDRKRYDLVVTLGHSMGGYASMLFASKIGADISIAVSAPTFLDPENRARYDDARYAEEKKKLWESVSGKGRYFDLQSYFLSQERAEDRCEYFLFYGERDRLDKIHANRMIGLRKSVNVFEVANGDHNTARLMRDSGLLSRLYENMLSIERGQDIDMLLDLLKMEPQVRQVLQPAYHRRDL